MTTAAQRERIQHGRARGGIRTAGSTAAAFTLVELLIVMAISIIILGLLFGPLVQGFNLTRRTQAITQAQDAIRFGLENLIRELSEAAFVYDNSSTPIILPLEDPADLRRDITYPANPSGLPPSTPPFLYAKLDFAPAATLQRQPGEIEDPTTGGKLGGTALRLPLSQSRRVVRYFIGLRRNFRVEAGGVVRPLYYNNIYEFPRSDNGEYNPFILYRAEFDPADPNLVNQDPALVDSQRPNDGGFDDPNFFYNVRSANSTNAAGRTGNGRSYAQNWRDVAAPVLTAGNLDLLTIRRNENREVSTAAPFGTTVSFSPATIAGDTATPGYLTDAENETPGAVPSVYTTKHGQWVLPYTVTVHRFTSRRSNLSDPKSGVLAVRVAAEQAPSNGQRRIVVRVMDSRNALATTQNINAGTLQQTNTPGFTFSFGRRGGLFIKTPNLTFVVDPLRGRIVTGFPPLADDPTRTGVPLFDANGEPVPTVFRLNTRHPDAGVTRPTNAGITEANLASPNYYPAFPLAATPVTPAPYRSPFALFGNGFADFGGAMIVAGSERVLGPDTAAARLDLSRPEPSSVNTELVPYSRVAALTALIPQSARTDNDPIVDGTSTYTGFPVGGLNYFLEDDLSPDQPLVRFDNSTAGSIPPPQGLPAARAGDPDQKEIQVTYLWQNNYARDERGWPVNANGQSASGSEDAATIRPEADVIKVNYSTRSLLNINMGVRVYDVATGRPQVVQVSDRVRVGNVGR